MKAISHDCFECIFCTSRDLALFHNLTCEKTTDVYDVKAMKIPKVTEQFLPLLFQRIPFLSIFFLCFFFFQFYGNLRSPVLYFISLVKLFARGLIANY